MDVEGQPTSGRVINLGQIVPQPVEATAVDLILQGESEAENAMRAEMHINSVRTLLSDCIISLEVIAREALSTGRANRDGIMGGVAGRFKTGLMVTNRTPQGRLVDYQSMIQFSIGSGEHRDDVKLRRLQTTIYKHGAGTTPSYQLAALKLDHNPKKTELRVELPLDESGIVGDTRLLLPQNPSLLVSLVELGTLDIRRRGHICEVAVTFSHAGFQPSFRLLHHVISGKRPAIVSREFEVDLENDKFASENIIMSDGTAINIPVAISSADFVKIVQEILGLLPSA